MLIKLAALGALGYAGYKYLDKRGMLPRTGTDSGTMRTAPDIRLAGGGLSNQATVQHTPEAPATA